VFRVDQKTFYTPRGGPNKFQMSSIKKFSLSLLNPNDDVVLIAHWQRTGVVENPSSAGCCNDIRLLLLLPSEPGAV